MASGVPVVASDVGGLPELIQHGESGLLFPMGDVDAMADGAEGLLKDPAELARLQKGARTRAEYFSQSKILDRYEALYRRVLSSE